MDKLIIELEQMKKKIPTYSHKLDQIIINKTIKNGERMTIKKPKTRLIFVTSLTTLIMTTFIVVISLIMNNVNLKPTDIGISQTNMGGNDISPNPLIFYKIDISKNEYTYEDIITVSFKMAKNQYEVIAEGDLEIKLIADDFYILSEDTYRYEHFESHLFNYDYRKQGTQKEWPISVDFQIKGLKVSEFTNSIKIMLKFNVDEEFKETDLMHDYSKEYLLEYEVFNMNDQLGIILSGNNKGQLFYKSLNRQFAINLIDKSVYMKRATLYSIDGISTIIYMGRANSQGQINYRFLYLSRHISATLSLNHDYAFLEELYDNNSEVTDKEIAKKLIEILRIGEFIDQEIYETEINFIDGNQLSRERQGYFNSSLIPFDDYLDYMYDYYFQS